VAKSSVRTAIAAGSTIAPADIQSSTTKSGSVRNQASIAQKKSIET
jgi:hypothetical protein